jgi:hypothetical protein
MPGRAPISPLSSALVWLGRVVAQAYRKLTVIHVKTFAIK